MILQVNSKPNASKISIQSANIFVPNTFINEKDLFIVLLLCYNFYKQNIYLYIFQS